MGAFECFDKGLNHAGIKLFACSRDDLLLGLLRGKWDTIRAAGQFLIGIGDRKNMGLDRNVDRTCPLILQNLLRNDDWNHPAYGNPDGLGASIGLMRLAKTCQHFGVRYVRGLVENVIAYAKSAEIAQ